MSYKIKKETALDEKEMREVFAETMTEIAEADERVVYLDCDLMNSLKMVPFARRFPERVINCGIQEANMIGTAAGMSELGLVPYAHSFGTFASRRVMDQVFVSAAYAKLNIRIIGSDPGVTASLNGGTHMPLEDIGMFRTIPEVTIIEPTDSAMLADVIKQTKDLYGVFYIRLSRKKAASIFEGDGFAIGKSITLRGGKDATIFASGISVADSLAAADELSKEGIEVSVKNIWTIKPIDEEAVKEAAEETGAIVTAENHNIIGGLGSAAAEVLAEKSPAPLERIGVRDRFGEVGSVDYLKKTFHMEKSDIAEAVRKVLARKRGVH